MKKFVYVSLFALASAFLTSCGADQATVDKMSGEMCSVMEKYDEADPSSMLTAANGMIEIAGKETEYGKVTEDQLYSAMEKQCPEGYKKFKALAESGK